MASSSSPPPATGSVVQLPFRGEIDAERLVAGALAEEPWAQAAIWDAYSRLVRRVLFRAIGATPDVEDALQEVFVQFFRSLRRLEDPGALRGFLLGIALRVGASERRRRRLKSWLSLTPNGELPERAAPHVDEHTRRALQRFYAILDGLDDDSRALFTLRHVEGLGLTEVATATNLSVATVKRKLAKIVPVVVARVRRDPTLASLLGERSSFPVAFGAAGEVGT